MKQRVHDINLSLLYYWDILFGQLKIMANDRVFTRISAVCLCTD